MARSPWSDERVQSAMRAVMDRVQRKREGLPAPQVLVRRGTTTFVSGERERPFHAASVGKLFTASLVMQHIDRGELALDTPITSALPEAEWAGLFVRDGVDAAPRVTIGHLLSHTSGVADYFGGTELAGGSDFVSEIVARPDRQWEPSELLEWTRQNLQPIGGPGEKFHYSDTGFVLLGRVVEELSQAPLARQLHECIFAPAGMDSTFQLLRTRPGGAPETAESPADDHNLSPLWLSGHEVSRARSLTADWAGGGVASTVDDLIRFSDAYLEGAIVSPSARAVMADTTHRFRTGIAYGHGMMRLHYAGFFPLLWGLPRPLGHNGVTATHLYFDEASGLRIAMNFHSTNEVTRSFQAHIRLVQYALRAAKSD